MTVPIVKYEVFNDCRQYPAKYSNNGAFMNPLPTSTHDVLRKVFLIATALSVLVSCATYRIETRTVPVSVPYAEQVHGRTLGVEPFTVSFGASRLALDLRDVTLIVDGQEIKLRTRYITKEDDISLGKIGILDTNIFKKAKVSEKNVAEKVNEVLLRGLSGTYDYNIGFFKGLGESNMGQLSNRPVERDDSKYPPTFSYLPATGATSYFSKVDFIPVHTEPTNSGYDYVLTGEISISNDVVEVIEDPPSSDMNKPKAGSYFITVLASVNMMLVDSKTGKVVIDENTKIDYPVRNAGSFNVPIDTPKGDAAAFAKYFRTVNLESYAVDQALVLLTAQFPKLAPFYASTFHNIKVDKK